jgi:hypothetical protein
MPINIINSNIYLRHLPNSKSMFWPNWTQRIRLPMNQPIPWAQSMAHLAAFPPLHPSHCWIVANSLLASFSEIQPIRLFWPVSVAVAVAFIQPNCQWHWPNSMPFYGIDHSSMFWCKWPKKTLQFGTKI